MRSTFAVPVLLSFLCLAPAAAGATAATEWRKSLPAGGPGVVQLDSLAGTVMVTGWDREQVEVSGTIDGGPSGVEPLLERRGERIVVRLETALMRGTTAHLEVRMPRKQRLEISGLNLDVGVDGIEGGIDVSVVGGTVRVRGARRETTGAAVGGVRLQTVSGVIQAEGAFDELELLSVSGPVEVTAAVRRLRVESESGPQTLRLRGSERVEVASLDGPIRLDLEAAAAPADGAQIQARSFRGILDIGLPATARATIDAAVRDGRIDNRLGGVEARESADDEGLRLRTRLGDATSSRTGLRIELSTFRGDIVLRPLAAG